MGGSPHGDDANSFTGQPALVEAGKDLQLAGE